MCKRFLLFFVTFLLSGIIFVLCCGGVDCSAVTYDQMSASDARSLWGDTISCTYTWSGVQYSSTLSYAGSCTMYGANIDTNDVLGSQNLSSYDVIMYKGSSSAGRYGWIRDLSVAFPFYTDSYVRGGFLARVGANNLDPVFDNNLIVNAPNNYFDSFHSLAAVSSNSGPIQPNYYNVIYANIPDGGRHTFRSILYESDNGINTDSVYFDNIQVDYYSQIYFCIICPYTSHDISISAPAETTITGNSGGQIIINNNVDLTETHSILGGISNFLSDIWEAIRGIPGSILQGLQGIFVPSEGFMDEQLADLQESFAWYDDIKKLGSDFRDAFENQSNASAPVISIPSMSSQGHSYTERSEIVLDLSDYQEAVLSVRVILSVLLWIFFLWRLYCRLPDIIHGGGMIIGDGSRIMDELDNRDSQNVSDDVTFTDHRFGGR